MRTSSLRYGARSPVPNAARSATAGDAFGNHRITADRANALDAGSESSDAWNDQAIGFYRRLQVCGDGNIGARPLQRTLRRTQVA